MNYLATSLTVLLFISTQAMNIQPPKVINHTVITQKENIKATKINHHIKGQDVYIESIVPNFTFISNGERKKAKHGEGHIHVYLNGKKVKEANRPAFILKDLPKGKHDITLKFVHNDESSYKYEETIRVIIK